jgi:hypothetical protein
MQYHSLSDEERKTIAKKSDLCSINDQDFFVRGVRPAPTRPLVEVEPTDHPIVVHQRDGIPLREVHALIERALHPVR